MKTRLLLVLCCLSMLTVFSPGCESSDSVRAARDQKQTEKTALDDAASKADAAIARMTKATEELDAEKTRLTELADRLEAGSAERTAVEKTIASVGDRLTVLDKSLVDATSASAEAKKTSADLGKRIEAADKILAASAPGTPNAGSDIGTVVGQFFPGAATLAPFLGGFIYRSVRLARAKSALEGQVNQKTTALDRIVASIDALAEIAPEVKTALGKHSAVLDTIQTPIGKIEVDRAQSRNTSPLLA